MKSISKALVALVAAVGVTIGAAGVAAAQEQQQTEPVVCYDVVPVTEYRYERDVVVQPKVTVTETLYQKQVRYWFLGFPGPWSNYSGITRWSTTPVTDTGFLSGNKAAGTEYRYVATSTTRTITLQEEIIETVDSGFVTEAPEGDGWVLVEERTVDVEVPVECPAPPPEACEYDDNLTTDDPNCIEPPVVDEEPPTEVPPTTEPPVTTPPTTEVPVEIGEPEIEVRETEVLGEVVTADPEETELAFTGSHTRELLTLGSLLVLAGALMVHRARKVRSI